MSMKRTILTVLILFAVLAAAWILYWNWPFSWPDNGHGGGTLTFEHYEGTAQPYNLTQADIDQLPQKVLDALQDAIDDGRSTVSLSDRQLGKTLDIMREYEDGRGNKLVRYRGVALKYGIVGQ